MANSHRKVITHREFIMPRKVTLSVTEGKLNAEAFAFEERASCFIGRGEDCEPRVPENKEYRSISRLHCLLDVNPPDARVRDLGSKYGTYVNGVKIGQRESEEQRGKPLFPEYDLKDGDEIRLGDPEVGKAVVFRVGIIVPTYCTRCSSEMPREREVQTESASGVDQCEACRRKGDDFFPTLQGPVTRRACVQCGKDISDELGNHQFGALLCGSCKDNPEEIVRQMLGLARSGQRELLAIQGYEILKELGRGGMGAVYLARHDRTRERIALKVMLPRVAANAWATQMFLREAALTGALKHPHLVRLRDSGCSTGTFFFTLEYCDGGSVDRLMKQRGGILSVAEAGEIILQVLAGLDHAHNAEVSVKLPDGSVAEAHGLVHRDLKPQNIFLSGSGSARVAKVGDYGLSKAFDLAGLSGLSRTGPAAGTPCFMPRQQVVNFKYARPEVDVWATAASLYFMLTGHTPRDFPEDKDRWQVVLDTQPVPIRRRQPSLPTHMAEVIDEALRDKAQQDRKALPFKTAAEFKQALESVL